MSDAVPGTSMDEHLLVGAVAVAGARAEFALQRLLVGLLQTQYAAIVTAGVPVNTLIANCKAIINVHADLTSEQRTEATNMVKEIGNLMETRNKLVHGLLAEDQSEGATSQTLALFAHRTPFQSKTMTVDEVREAAGRLRTVAGNLLVWTFQTLPGASQQQVLPPRKGR